MSFPQEKLVVHLVLAAVAVEINGVASSRSDIEKGLEIGYNQRRIGSALVKVGTGIIGWDNIVTGNFDDRGNIFIRAEILGCKCHIKIGD